MSWRDTITPLSEEQKKTLKFKEDKPKAPTSDWRSTITPMTQQEQANVKFKEEAPAPTERESLEQSLPGDTQKDLYTQTREPTQLAAGVRGLVQGGTLGFSDEIKGAVQAPFSDRSYTQIRDEERARNEAAEKRHPGTYLY